MNHSRSRRFTSVEIHSRAWMVEEYRTAGLSPPRSSSLVSAERRTDWSASGTVVPDGLRARGCPGSLPRGRCMYCSEPVGAVVVAPHLEAAGGLLDGQLSRRQAVRVAPQPHRAELLERRPIGRVRHDLQARAAAPGALDRGDVVPAGLDRLRARLVREHGVHLQAGLSNPPGERPGPAPAGTMVAPIWARVARMDSRARRRFTCGLPPSLGAPVPRRGYCDL